MTAMRVVLAVGAISLAGGVVGACSTTYILPGSGTSEDGGVHVDGSNDAGMGGPGAACVTSDECYSGKDCASVSCEAGKCVALDLPAGTPAPAPKMTASACQRVACDGKGGEMLVANPEGVPPSNGAYCQKVACDDAGHTTYAPDPSNVPPGPAPACKQSACDDAGHATYVPDPSNVPDAGEGACSMTVCDDAGTASTIPVPANLPPSTMCASYACPDGTPVEQPMNQGIVCSPLGLACDNSGSCDVCPPLDAQCTDTGPGASARTLAAAYGFGTIGLCDSDGLAACGALGANEQSWFSYTSSGYLSTCSFDPYVSVQATAAVTLCEYFVGVTVTCPGGSTNATDSEGDPGCCITTNNGSMAISASDDDGLVYIQVEDPTASCVGYMLSFHS